MTDTAKTQRVFLVDGARTPFLKARGGPGPFTPVDLAVQCGRPLLARQGFDRAALDLVILGCVNVIADEMNPARVAALRLGLGAQMVAFTMQINCGSATCADRPDRGDDADADGQNRPHQSCCKLGNVRRGCAGTPYCLRRKGRLRWQTGQT